MTDLKDLYEAYIDCLNARDWARLGQHVHDSVRHNDRPLGLAGYRALLEADVAAIPDLAFKVELLICEPPDLAARLSFTCTPKGEFLGLPVNGRTVSFTENVFYTYRDSKIWTVLSVIDKPAIERQL
ncbi:ester cyclase [Rhizobium sp. CC-YZS058]|uniref:ester cyclase n=1 Tax=Rhizobium sp. CC-YZS058 TaxID=3042153 RepID=UPI002B05A0E6|nr:ester cyclase [Rhizobium sp. CC-YZS058]MEA3535808.1 ester cyclase [Rhizobium sp. CC-YZS058]